MHKEKGKEKKRKEKGTTIDCMTHRAIALCKPTSSH